MGLKFTRSPNSQLPNPLQNFWCQTHYLQKLFLAKLPRHRAEDARANRLAGFVDQHGRILIEADVSPVAAPVFLACANYDRLHDFSFLHLAIGSSFLHAGRDHVAKAGTQTSRSAKRQNHLQLARAAVIGDLEHASHHDCHISSPKLAYFCPSAPDATSGTSAVLRTTSFRRHRFSFESGRVSSRRTTSPMCASFFSS